MATEPTAVKKQTEKNRGEESVDDDVPCSAARHGCGVLKMSLKE